MLRLARAQISDVAAWAAEQQRFGSPLSRRTYNCLMAQVLLGESYVARAGSDGGPPLFIAGCWDLAGRVGEIWFLVQNGGLGRHLLRAHRLALRWFGQAAVTRSAFVAYVAADNRSGQRLVRALGFAPTGACVMGFDEWRRGSDESRVAVDGGRRLEEGAPRAGAPAGAA